MAVWLSLCMPTSLDQTSNPWVGPDKVTYDTWKETRRWIGLDPPDGGGTQGKLHLEFLDFPATLLPCGHVELPISSFHIA